MSLPHSTCDWSPDVQICLYHPRTQHPRSFPQPCTLVRNNNNKAPTNHVKLGKHNSQAGASTLRTWERAEPSMLKWQVDLHLLFAPLSCLASPFKRALEVFVFEFDSYITCITWLCHCNPSNSPIQNLHMEASLFWELQSQVLQFIDPVDFFEKLLKPTTLQLLQLFQ